MEKTFRSQLKTVLIRLSILFLLFFGFRLLYGYRSSPETDGFSADFNEELTSLRRNFASYKMEKSGPPPDIDPNSPPPPPGSAQSQKYERVANIRTRSNRFAEDEAAVKAKIRDFKGIIQYEKNQGNPGQRIMFLQIGVAPTLFDSCYNVMQQYGKVLYKEAVKTDMTSEFLKLNAQKASLEKTRAALLDLKKRGGDINEFVSLENTLLDIERQLQELGVELGSYAEENEFCTVRFYLAEGKEREISFLHRVKVALEWTLTYYALFLLCLLFALATAWLLIAVIDKWGLLARLLDRKNS